MKKKLPTDQIMGDLKSGSVFFSKNKASGKNVDSNNKPKENGKQIDETVPSREKARDHVRDRSRGKARENLREYPTRDEIQEFSFRLRDELKVKVQAEVPHQWKGELDEVARKIGVRKLELYRFIIGEFLGHIKRRQRDA